MIVLEYAVFLVTFASLLLDCNHFVCLEIKMKEWSFCYGHWPMLLALFLAELLPQFKVWPGNYFNAGKLVKGL